MRATYPHVSKTTEENYPFYARPKRGFASRRASTCSRVLGVGSVNELKGGISPTSAIPETSMAIISGENATDGALLT
jgi:hypothetical protein